VIDEIAKLRAEVAELAAKLETLEAGSTSVEGKGARGADNLLGELLGKRVRFRLEDGRVLEGVLDRYQLRCLRIATSEGIRILNTRSIDTLELLGDGPGGGRGPGDGGKLGRGRGPGKGAGGGKPKRKDGA